MNFSSTKPMRFHVDGELEIADGQQPIPAPVPEQRDTVTVSGRLTQARTGTSLPGLRVLALANSGSHHSTKLGSSTSNANGQFRIQFDDTPEVRERLLALRYLPDSRLRLRVEAANEHTIFTSPPIALDNGSVEIALAIPLSAKSVAVNTWATLGKHFQQSRIAHLNNVVRLLSDDEAIDGQAAAVSGIPMLTRQAMLDQMEQAFLDPTGILRQTAGDIPSLQELHDPSRRRPISIVCTRIASTPQSNPPSFLTIPDIRRKEFEVPTGGCLARRPRPVTKGMRLMNAQQPAVPVLSHQLAGGGASDEADQRVVASIIPPQAKHPCSRPPTLTNRFRGLVRACRFRDINKRADMNAPRLY